MDPESERRRRILKSCKKERKSDRNKRPFIKGDLEAVKSICKAESVSCNLYKEDMINIIKNGNKKIMKYAALKCTHVYVDETIVTSCFLVRWEGIVKFLLQRSDVVVNDLRNNTCIIGILKFHNDYISNKVITADLDYMGINERVMIDLISKLMRITFIDPEHNNSIFIKAASKNGHHQIVDILRSHYTPPQDRKLETLIALNRFGGF